MLPGLRSQDFGCLPGWSILSISWEGLVRVRGYAGEACWTIMSISWEGSDFVGPFWGMQVPGASRPLASKAIRGGLGMQVPSSITGTSPEAMGMASWEGLGMQPLSCSIMGNS